MSFDKLRMTESLQNTPTPAQTRRFRRFGIATVVLVYLVVLAGGIVRTTGSGMGCPDWPMCFGRLIPPTEVSQLPPDYQTRYAIPGHVPVFNPVKTWIEYINRLLGALCGVAVLGTAVFSLPYWRIRPSVVVAAVAALVLILVVAWLGKLVVEQVLLPGAVTIHMLLALLTVSVLIYAVAWPQIPAGGTVPKAVTWWVAAGLVVTLVQIVLGTQVREAVDVVAAANPTGRASWLDAVSYLNLHRAMSYFPLAAIVFSQWPYIIRGKAIPRDASYRAAILVVLIVLITYILGFILVYAGFPAWAQPLHLLLATLLAGAYVFWLLVVVKTSRAA